MQKVPTIETDVYRQIESAIRQVGRTATLGVVRGPYGVGKTYAMRDVCEKLNSPHFKIEVVTGNPTINGHMLGFFNTLLSNFGRTERKIHDAMEEFYGALAISYFKPFCAQSVLIVDESQGLTASVLDTLRSLWDRGDRTRMLREGPAFGILFIANHRFTDRRGAVRTMKLSPLKDRISFLIDLKSPSTADLIEVASAYSGDDAEIAELLARSGESRGNIRSIANAYRSACGLAAPSPVSVADVEYAISQNGEL